MRLLKTIVIGMGILLVLGFGALIMAFILVGKKSPTATTAAAIYVPSPSGPAYALDIPPPAGAHLDSVQPSGDQVLFRFTGAGGTRVLVVDPHEGRVTGTINVPSPAAPPTPPPAAGSPATNPPQ